MLVEDYRAGTLHDSHRDGPEFGYRFVAGETAGSGGILCRRTAWRVCRNNQWRPAFGKKPTKYGERPGSLVHDDLVPWGLSADDADEL